MVDSGADALFFISLSCLGNKEPAWAVPGTLQEDREELSPELLVDQLG